MISQKLEQIDRRIVELLKERIALVNSGAIASPKEEIAALTPLLTSIGIPQELWSESFANGSTSIEAKSSKSDRSRRITIVGGKGRMGQLFTQQLTAAGHSVRSLGRKDWHNAPSLLGEAELVLISVPIEQTEAIIERTAQYLAPTTAIADITSIKTAPVAKMLACHDGAVMGLHPMFGPNKNFNKQKIVVCYGRHNDSFQWLLDFMAERGGELIYCSPQEHDRLMAIVQAVRHFSQFGFGVFLKSERIDTQSSLSVASPNYRSEYEALLSFFQQNPSMYIDIMLATETSCQTIERLATTYRELAELIAKKDRDALIEIFANAKDLFTEPELPLAGKA